MKTIICLLGVLGYTCGFAINNTIDWSKVRSEDIYVNPEGIAHFGPGGRIIGGSVVVRHSAPYQAAVINSENGLCGGSLISRTAVLTAAHCTFGHSSVRVILGAHNVQQNESSQVIITSTNIINHLGYNRYTYVNDIALVILPSPVTLNNNIRIIDIAPDKSGTFEGSRALLTGWGRTTDSSQLLSPVLRGVRLNIITNAECQQSFGDFVTASNICSNGERIVGGCGGDSGGPLVVKNVQVGVASFHARECAAGYPTAYARVNHYYNWIRSNS